MPEGFLSLDFVPARSGQAGPPYISQFAYAVFAGDPDTMHQREGYDCDAMYDITRNTMLAQGVGIPYPDKYWTAEAYLEGCHRPAPPICSARNYNSRFSRPAYRGRKKFLSVEWIAASQSYYS